jgi:Putative transposase
VAGLERLAQYMVRCPLSLARMTRVTDEGSVIYRAEKAECRRFPQAAAAADLRAGPRRNFQVFDVFDFLAELTQHIPDKGEHLVRGHRPEVGRGWYSCRRRGMRAKQAATNEIKIDRSQARGDRTSQSESKAPHLSTWAALIQRVYETDPLTCPRCGSKMRIISFIETHQRDVIEKILRGHQSGAMVDGLWEGPRAPWPTREPRRNEARGRTETSRASCNWSSIPNSSDFSGVSQPCRIEETKNFFTGAATQRVRAKPLGKASGLAAAKAG